MVQSENTMNIIVLKNKSVNLLSIWIEKKIAWSCEVRIY